MSPQTGVPQESFHHSPLCSYHKSAKSAQNKTKRQLLATIGEFKKITTYLYVFKHFAYEESLVGSYIVQKGQELAKNRSL